MVDVVQKWYLDIGGAIYCMIVNDQKYLFFFSDDPGIKRGKMNEEEYNQIRKKCYKCIEFHNMNDVPNDCSMAIIW